METPSDIARRYGVELMLQFGSTVGGAVHSHSDVDVAVLLASPLDLKRFAELHHDLQQLFPEHEVDLAVLNHADPLFLKQVLDRARLLHGDLRRFMQLKMYAFRRYQEHRPYLAMERRYVDRVLAGFEASRS